MSEDASTDLERARLEFEREKHRDEIKVRTLELDLKNTQRPQSPWRNPLFLALVAAIAGLLSNAVVAFINGSSERELEREKAEAMRALNEQEAEADRVLEAIKTGDTTTAVQNLRMLVKTGLVTKGADKITAYVETLRPGEGASLPGGTPPEGISLDQLVVFGKPRVAAITVVNNRSESILVFPTDGQNPAILIEPQGSWTVQTTVDPLTTPREWRRHDEFDILYIDDRSTGSILTTLGPIEYFLAQGIDTYVLLIDVGDPERLWRVEIRVDASAMSADEPFRGDLVIADDEMVTLRIP